MLAIDGKIDFVKKTNPFGSGDEEDNSKAKTHDDARKKQKRRKDQKGRDRFPKKQPNDLENRIKSAFAQFAKADKQKQSNKPTSIEKQQ